VSEFVAIEITCPDAATAARLGEHLVARRLAACAQVRAAHASRYRWKGRIETAVETPLVVKTRAAHFDAVAEAVRALHPYETPAVVATPIVAAAPDYAAWLAAETADVLP
jgi:periplasmic divalent cation tolerance protein